MAGVKVTKNTLGTIGSQLRGKVASAVGVSALDLEGEIKQNIVTVGAVDTGTMLNATQAEHASGSLEASVTNATDYWPHVNYGTSRVAARPFVEPAVDAVRPRFEQRIKDALNP